MSNQISNWFFLQLVDFACIGDYINPLLFFTSRDTQPGPLMQHQTIYNCIPKQPNYPLDHVHIFFIHYSITQSHLSHVVCLGNISTGCPARCVGVTTMTVTVV